MLAGAMNDVDPTAHEKRRQNMTPPPPMTLPTTERRRRRHQRSRRTALGRLRSALVAGLVTSVLALHLIGPTTAATAVLDLPGSSAGQIDPQLPTAPLIIAVEAADARLLVDVAAAPNGPPAVIYEYSTDGGVTWRVRDDATGTTTPLAIATTSDTAASLTNGTTYGIRLRGASPAGAGGASNLVPATPVAVQPPPPGPDQDVRWISVLGGHNISTGPDTSAISFGGAGERRALVDMPPASHSTFALTGTRFTRGNGWGVIVHGGTDAQGEFEGYTVQFERRGEVSVRTWHGGTEFNQPLATSATTPVTNDVHDVRIEVDGIRLRVLFDDVEVLVIPDLPVAVAAVGAPGAGRTSGVLGLRAWTNTDLVVEAATLTLR